MQTFTASEPQQFLQRLRETATWCELPSAGAASLRSDMFRPEVMNGSEDIAIGTKRERHLAVESLATKRAQQLSTTLMPRDGRLLAYDPDASLFDGAATVATQGFFDFNNTPPWDTWLCFIANDADEAGKWVAFDAYLLSWVPAHYIDLVNKGIDANPEGCICWAIDLDSPFIHQLKQWGLIA